LKSNSSSYGIAYLPPGGAYDSTLLDRVDQAVQQATPPGTTSALTGLAALQSTNSNSGGVGLLAETLIGGLGALIVLAFVFASFVAFLPLVMAGVSILTTFLLVLGLTTVTDVNFIAQFIIGLIGLGVAIDYALLVVTRWREERAAGADNRHAVEQAMAHAGRAVMFSGIVVTIGLLALVVLPVASLRSFGYAGALIPLVSVLVATTLLPVLLDTIGPRLDWPRIRSEKSASRAWTAWARGIVRFRWVALLAGVVILVALAAPVLNLQLGEARAEALGTSGPARTAYDRLDHKGAVTPIVVLSGDAEKLRNIEGIETVIQEGDLLTAIPAEEGGANKGKEIVQRVRDTLGKDAVITGDGAAQLDFRQSVYGRFPLMLGVVCLLTFLLLARAFRSIVLPLKAVLCNLISLGAAYGILVLVWQDGHGSQALWDTPSTGAIAMWIPLMVFAFLFGLSMDYEVFLLSRMREAYDSGEDTDQAVVTGLARTGRLVTCAALILMLAFLSMSTAPDTDVRVLATGLGAGILIDAVVVRSLLVPSLVSLFGKWNWWLPGRRTPSSPAAERITVNA
jgi:RND superfamily putative drug exporter